MMISTRGRYALRVMIDMALHDDGGYIPLKEIAKRQEISLKYIERIIQILKKNNFVDSAYGKGGGYRLSKNADEYSIKDILILTEGSLAPVACLECGAAPCLKKDTCRTLGMWKKLHKTVNDFFENISIADLVADRDF